MQAAVVKVTRFVFSKFRNYPKGEPRYVDKTDMPSNKSANESDRRG